ncbi:MAG: hypothetical protein NC078_01095, partial [Ruminococcus sp.]|nr:hypothetical protein [Ruminococcus sp.]
MKVNELLIACITSVDMFAAVTGLCCGGIKLPRKSGAAAAFVGAAALGIAAALSEWLTGLAGPALWEWGAAYIS